MLEPLPEHAIRRIVVGSTVRKSLPILKAHLQSLDWQTLPPQTVVDYCFVADWPEPKTEAEQYLRDWVKQRKGTVLSGGPTASNDFSDTHAQTHQWAESAMRRVGANKNKILNHARLTKADFVWFVDSDLILDRTTLWSLLHTRRPIVAGVYWTKWQKTPTPDLVVHAGPQVWLQHPYQLYGRGKDEAEFRRDLIQRKLIQVWGQGACTLLDKRVLDSGLDFSPQPEVPQQGLMAGEDRQFCIGAERKHIPMYADAWPDIFHIYHLPDDTQRIPEMLSRLGAEHPERARTGDWVSLLLQPLEGIPNPSGPPALIGPQDVRGRIGALDLLPELEEAVYETPRGQTKIVAVHVPIHHPIPQLRGTKRLIRLTVVDCKPYQFAPVLEYELYQGELSRGVHDAVTLTQAQHDSILAGHPSTEA